MEAQQSAGGGGKTAERVSGPDLMEAVVKANAEYPGLRHFLLGGDERTLETLAASWRKSTPVFVWPEFILRRSAPGVRRICRI